MEESFDHDLNHDFALVDLEVVVQQAEAESVVHVMAEERCPRAFDRVLVERVTRAVR